MRLLWAAIAIAATTVAVAMPLEERSFWEAVRAGRTDAALAFLQDLPLETRASLAQAGQEAARESGFRILARELRQQWQPNRSQAVHLQSQRPRLGSILAGLAQNWVSSAFAWNQTPVSGNMEKIGDRDDNEDLWEGFWPFQHPANAPEDSQVAREMYLSAVLDGNVDLAVYLLSMQLEDVSVSTANDFGETGLHLSARAGMPVLTRELLAREADPNAVDWHLRTPLFGAFQVQVVRMLLRAGAEVAHYDEYGDTPLHHAAGLATAVVRELLDAGAPPNAVNNKEMTPLCQAITYGSAPDVELLLAAGANVNLRNGDGESSFAKSVREERLDLVRLMLRPGLADPPPDWHLTKRRESLLLAQIGGFPELEQSPAMLAERSRSQQLRDLLPALENELPPEVARRP